MRIRDATSEDYLTLYQLNQSEIPHVSGLPVESFMKICREADFLRIAEVDREVAGFLLGFRETASYESLNFQWFKKRYLQFFYIDRIVVGSSFRRKGVGRALYENAEQFAKSGAKLLTCEVNIRPPNPESMDFHLALNFAQVGTQATEAGTKTVALLAKQL